MNRSVIHNVFILLKLSLFALFLHSCVDVAELSDSNTIRSFTIISGSPSSIEFGEIVIKGDSVIVPILYGIDKFPLTLTAEFDFGGKIDCIVGADFKEGVIIDDIEDSKEFYVMAQSGLSRKYSLVFKEGEYSELSSIAFSYEDLSPESSIVYNKATLMGMEFVISAVDISYPFSITPKFSEDIFSYEGFENGVTKFTFEDASDTHDIIVVDKKTGSKRDYSLRTGNLRLVSGGDGDFEATNLFNSDLKFKISDTEEDLEVKGFRIDNSRDSISVYLKKSGDDGFPLEMEVGFGEVEQRCGLIGVTDGESIELNDFGEAFRYYIVDPAAAIARYWQIVPVEYKEAGEAEILSFVCGYNYKHNIVIDATGIQIKKPIILDTNSVEIFPQTSEIWLKGTDIYNAKSSVNWKVILERVEITVSEGATCDAPDPIQWIGNNSWKESRELKVTSSNGDVRIWTINIRDYSDPTPSSEKEILGADISYMTPLMAKADPNVPITMNDLERKIYVRLEEDEECYPLSVMLDYKLSQFARVTSQQNNTVPIVFETPEHIETVVVTAEDGTESLWTVELIRPEKVEAANVLSFAIDGYSSPVFKTGTHTIDTENGEIIITLKQSGSCPATINYSMSLSRKATADVPLKGGFKFDNLNSVVKFTVTSSGGTDKEWSVKIVPHTPQLENWDLEKWESDDKTLIPAGKKGSPYWASANNAFVTGTTKGAGRNGGSGAKLYTQTAVGKLASGSLLLGWFNSENPTAGLSDPVKLVFQGIEFSASKKLIAVELDVNYTSGGDGNDTGSVTVEFVKQNPYNRATYVYHGKRPDGTIHPDNTAVSIAKGQHIIANKASIGGTIVIPSNQWQTVRVELNYGSNNPLDYTHFVIICASSSQGDSFIGNSGTTMLIDNVKLIY